MTARISYKADQNKISQPNEMSKASRPRSRSLDDADSYSLSTAVPFGRKIAFPPEALSDICLVYEYVEFLCHTQILSMHSKVFCTTFADFPSGNDRRIDYPTMKNPLGELVKPEDFEHFLKCLYSPALLTENYRLKEPAINGKFSQFSVVHCAHYLDCSLLEDYFFPSQASALEKTMDFWPRLLCAEFYDRKDHVDFLIHHAAAYFFYYSGHSDSSMKASYNLYYPKISLETRERLQFQRAEYLSKQFPIELRTTPDLTTNFKDRMFWRVGTVVDRLDETLIFWGTAEIKQMRDRDIKREYSFHEHGTSRSSWVSADSYTLAPLGTYTGKR